MCASVSALCDTNTASRATIWGGPDVTGCIRATTRRMTAATAITMETHNPVRTKLHDRAGSVSPDVLILACTELFMSPLAGRNPIN